jgi:hypothetical protein
MKAAAKKVPLEEHEEVEVHDYLIALNAISGIGRDIKHGCKLIDDDVIISLTADGFFSKNGIDFDDNEHAATYIGFGKKYLDMYSKLQFNDVKTYTVMTMRMDKKSEPLITDFYAKEIQKNVKESGIKNHNFSNEM